MRLLLCCRKSQIDRELYSFLTTGQRSNACIHLLFRECLSLSKNPLNSAPERLLLTAVERSECVGRQPNDFILQTGNLIWRNRARQFGRQRRNFRTARFVPLLLGKQRLANRLYRTAKQRPGFQCKVLIGECQLDRCSLLFFERLGERQ